MGFKKTSRAVIAAIAALAAAAVCAQVRGVTKDEILLGSHIDLSGPIAELGRAGVNSGKMAEEEINAAGGIHGRKLRIIWEDSGYDPKKAVLAGLKVKKHVKTSLAPGSQVVTEYFEASGDFRRAKSGEAAAAGLRHSRGPGQTQDATERNSVSHQNGKRM